MPSRSRGRKAAVLSGVYFFIAGACLAFAFTQRAASGAHREARRGGEAAAYEAEVSADRAAGVWTAFAVLATIGYLLALGVIVGPRPIALVAGNLIVLLGLLLFLEIGARVVGFRAPAIPRAERVRAHRLWVYDDTKGWFHAPSSKGEIFAGGPDRGAVRINSLGLRGKEPRLDLPEMTRVLVLGDSYVFGIGVDEEHLVTTRLEELLRPHFPSGVEVVNMGVSGYSTDQELILFRELGPSLAPAIVVLVLCNNDYFANTADFVLLRYYKPYFELGEGEELHLRNVPVPRLTTTQQAKLWLGQESNVWNFVRTRKFPHPALQRLADRLQVGVPRRPRGPYRTTRALIKALSREAERLGARFFLTSTGHREEDPAVFRTFSRSLAREGIPHFDLYPVLDHGRRSEPDRLWDFGYDPHWNVDAHELAARSIYEFMKESYGEWRE